MNHFVPSWLISPSPKQFQPFWQRVGICEEGLCKMACINGVFLSDVVNVMNFISNNSHLVSPLGDRVGKLELCAKRLNSRRKIFIPLIVTLAFSP